MKDRYLNSNKFIKFAENLIPLGTQTNSKSKYQYPLNESPLFVESARGSKVWDIDGNEYVDLVCGLLPIILGYCDKDVDKAIKNELTKGISYSLPSKREAELSELLVEFIPCAEMVRFGKNGSDATSASIRLARYITQKEHIIAIGYHGWQDWYIGSTSMHYGVPKAVRNLVHKISYNDIEDLEKLFEHYKNKIAAVIMEPMSSVEPDKDYLKNVKKIAHKNKSLLIYDEVITGFRFSLGGAQELFNVEPDLAVFGKAMANGMPLSALVGRREYMEKMTNIFFSGTFSGENLSLAASIATITKIKNENVLEHIWNKGLSLEFKLTKLIKKYNFQKIITLTGKPPWKFIQFKLGDLKKNQILKTLFIREMALNGVLIQGSHNISYSLKKSEERVILKAYESFFIKLDLIMKKGDLLDERLITPIIPVFSVRS